METVLSINDLIDRIEKMTKDNSVCQVFIPGKGKFTIVLQEEDTQSIAAEVQSDNELPVAIPLYVEKGWLF